MILPMLTEMTLVSIMGRGEANNECIVIRVEQDIEVSSYGLMVGLRAPDGSVSPLNDCLYSFGRGLLRRGEWVFLFTGHGNPTVTTSQIDNKNIYSVHWGRDRTMFANSAVTAILFRMNAAQFSFAPADVPQMAVTTLNPAI